MLLQISGAGFFFPFNASPCGISLPARLRSEHQTDYTGTRKTHSIKHTSPRVIRDLVMVTIKGHGTFTRFTIGTVTVSRDCGIIESDWDMILALRQIAAKDLDN